MLEKIIFIREQDKWNLIGARKMITLMELFLQDYVVLNFVDEDIQGNPHNLKWYSTDTTCIEFIQNDQELSLKISDLHDYDKSVYLIMSYTLFRKMVITLLELDTVHGRYWSETAEKIEIALDVDNNYFNINVVPSTSIPKNMHIIEYRQSLKNK